MLPELDSVSRIMMGFVRLCKNVCSASKTAPNRDYKLSLSSLPGVRTSLSPVSTNLSKFECSGRRHYCVERDQYGKFQPLIKYLRYFSVFFGKFERVPFTKQTVLVFPFFDKVYRNVDVETSKEVLFRGKKVGDILPDTNPHCVRVREIAKKVVKGLERETGRHHTLAENQWPEEDDKVVKLVQEAGKSGGLEGRNWEVFVLDGPDVNAYYTRSGKIILGTALCDLYKTDAEIAFVIGHEIGHVVSRHSLRRYTWFRFEWLRVVLSCLVLFSQNFDIYLPFLISHLVIYGKDPRTRLILRHEQEADYIGMFLSASAGYDPRVAPVALGKLETEHGLSSFLEERNKFLSQPKVMQEAVSIYENYVKIQGTN